MSRFLRPGMKVQQNPNNRVAITHQGVFWVCGGCGMKNVMREPGCRMCRRGHNVAL